MRLRVVASLLTIALLVVVRRAWGQSTLVVLVGPPSGDATSAQVVQRARGELLADGFGVELAAPVAVGDRPALLARLGRSSGAPLTAGLFVAGDAASIELYLVDDGAAHVLTRYLDARADGVQPPEVLARRAVDLLQAALLDFSTAAPAAPPPPAPAPAPVHAPPAPPPATAPAPPPPPAPAEAVRTRPPAAPPAASAASRRRWTIAAGAGVIGSLEGIGPSLVPLLRVGYAPVDELQLRATGAWFGTQPSVQSPLGSAQIDQGLGLFEAALRWTKLSWLRPQLSLGAGVYYFGVNGRGDPPYAGKQSSGVSLALDGGVGLAAPLGSRLELALEGHALWAEPGMAVRFVDADAANAGRPSLLGSLTLAGSI